jgi:predicted permease
MGPGLTIAALGTGSAVPTALIFVFDCMLFFTLVPLLMALGSSRQAKFGPLMLEVAIKVVTHPFNLATAVAVLASYFQFQPPQAADQLLTFLRNAAAPCALFALGVTVALRPVKGLPVEIPVHLLMKLVLHPLLVWVVLSYVAEFDRVWVFTAMLMAALPPASNVFVMARQFDEYVERASTGVLIGTVMSVFTVTGLLILISEGHIPHDLFPAG